MPDHQVEAQTGTIGATPRFGSPTIWRRRKKPTSGSSMASSTPQKSNACGCGEADLTRYDLSAKRVIFRQFFGKIVTKPISFQRRLYGFPAYPKTRHSRGYPHPIHLS
jgi:hypothetical protein